MIATRIYQLSDCTEYRQTLLARPPRLVHGTYLLLIAGVIAGLLWATWTQADLVVRAAGRIRPTLHGQQTAAAPNEESRVCTLHGGRVAEVHVQEGDRVTQGDILVVFDTEQLGNEIAKSQRALEAAQAELTKLQQLEQLTAERFETAQAKALAELDAAEHELRLQQERRLSEIGLAQLDCELAEQEWKRAELLAQQQAVSTAEREKAKSRCQETRLKLTRAQLPVDEGRLPALRQAVELVDRERQVTQAELASKGELKRAEIGAVQLELASLTLKRRQAELRAPADGIVTSLTAKVGEVLDAGQAVAAVADMSGFRLDVAVTSEDVGHLRVGLPVRVKLDAYDYQKYGTLTGRVIFIAPDSQLSSSSELPRIPTYTVKVALDDTLVQRGEFSGQVKLGMTGKAEIVTGQENILRLFLRSFRQAISLG